MSIIDSLEAKINNNSAVVAIVGLGYVGLPLMLRYNEIGYKVVGFDIDENKVTQLNNGQSYIEHISSNRITSAIKTGFKATTDFSHISECDIIILCVPTPLNKYREPDISFIIDTTDMLKPFLRKGQLLSLESTTYPGTTNEELLPRIEEKGFIVGEDIFLVYSPEREDPGNPNFETRTIPKVIGGHTDSCLRAGKAIYSKAIEQIVPVSSTKAAEMTKLLENIHRAVNIGLVNEMKIVADKMGIDIFEVIDAAATKPFGFTAYYPGPGLGGHCIPIDPFYLTWKAREYGVNTRFIELSGEINRAMPEYVLNKLIDGLNQQGKALSRSKVLILEIAYKKNVDDMRESPSVELMEIIQEKGATIAYSDPHVPVFPKMREHHFNLSSEEISIDTLSKFDAIILATNHDKFDYPLIKKHSKLLIDTRGIYREPAENIIKA
ncbi:nucleotide sugar dehydrogenase [Providencia sp. DFU6]|uniref:Nucleotide sugar dehydrogenase n=1 Tax=Providencia stuartii TaxID=588 RepID=A0ABD5L9T3_PROST|nr:MULTISPECIES: nucleotide sugar dehydrogenase [Providencia]MCR4181950.1 nucleotide sugar dehydrogenase [Providencia vermicola]URE78548.1 nucleotide sugar dehydrogenase [Providencia stuartii]